MLRAPCSQKNPAENGGPHVTTPFSRPLHALIGLPSLRTWRNRDHQRCRKSALSTSSACLCKIPKPSPPDRSSNGVTSKDHHTRTRSGVATPLQNNAIVFVCFYYSEWVTLGINCVYWLPLIDQILAWHKASGALRSSVMKAARPCQSACCCCCCWWWWWLFLLLLVVVETKAPAQHSRHML